MAAKGNQPTTANNRTGSIYTLEKRERAVSRKIISTITTYQMQTRVILKIHEFVGWDFW
jgi:hypothetical protein